MMTALGPCSALTPSTFIQINEVTTVAAVAALAPFMTGYAAVGSGSSDAAALANAFTLASELANTATGQAPGANVPPGLAVPTALMNTLANVVAACVNSAGGAAGDNSPCGSLFALTTPSGGVAPADTIKAMLYLAQNPGLNTSALFNLITPAAPFQPQLTLTPPAFGIKLVPATASGYVLQVGPSSLTFPNTTVASNSGQQTVVLSNSGSAAISISNVSILGANPGDFSQASTCGSSLAAGATCTIPVTFTPQAAGTRNAYLSISSSSPDSPQYVQLSGTGVAATTGVPHAVLSTNYELMTAIGASYDMTLSNTGTAPLAIYSISILTTSNTLLNGCGSSLAAGATCTVTIVSLAPALDQITFATNDPTLTPGVTLNSIQIIPFIFPSDLYFPDTAVGTSNTAYFDYPSATASPSITGTNASEFGVTTSCASSSCLFTVTFTPAAAGLRTAKLFYKGYGDATAYIPLAGNGLASAASSNYTLSPSLLNFSDLAAPQPVTFSNYSQNAISIQSISIQSATGPGEFSQTNNCGASLPAQSVCTITVASNRRLQGGTQGLLSVSGDFGSVGIPVANQIEQFYDFGSAMLGTSVSNFTLYSPSSRTGSLLTEQFLGANPSDFYQSGCLGAPTCSVTNSFRPTAVGLRTAKLLATSSIFQGPTTSQTYLLEGTGTTTPVSGLLFTGNSFAVTPGLGVQVYARNMGTTTLSFPNLPTFSGQTPGEFSNVTSSCGTLLPGGSCNIGFTVSPTQYGVATPAMSLVDTATGTTFSTPLYVLGYVGPPVSPATMNFSDTLVGDVSSPMSITVTPDYGHAVAAYLSTPGLALTKSTCAQGESPCVITAVFVPGAAQSYAGTLEIVDLYFGTGTAVQLTGKGIVPVIPGVASVSPSGLTFAQRPAGSTSIPQTLTLSNTGAGPFSFSYALTGTNASEFSTSTTTCTGTLAANSNCAVGVSFAPATPGSKSASLVISGSSNAGLPITVPITGSAN
jgi:hypothetical protein